MAEQGPRHRVLVIDDEPQVRATLHEALVFEGYDVTEASNGAEALAMLGDLHPAAIVLDLWMPVMDGWAFRRAQLASHPGIPVIVLSALDAGSQRVDELRADALLAKPFDLDVLYAAVRDLIATRG